MYSELVELLKNKGLIISTAESLTGGLISSKIVDIAGSSNVLKEAFVTYSNEAKIKTLGVKKETIDKYDVVSEEVTLEMAQGLYKKTNADICVAVSGYAGPTGENVGKVCITLKVMDKYFSYTQNYGNIGRNNVREKTCEFVCQNLLILLK